MGVEPLALCPFEHAVDPLSPHIVRVGEWRRVECPTCGATGPLRAEENHARAAWNRRAVPREQVLAAMVAALDYEDADHDDHVNSWFHERLRRLLDGEIGNFVNFAYAADDKTAVAVAHALGWPGAKVPVDPVVQRMLASGWTYEDQPGKMRGWPTAALWSHPRHPTLSPFYWSDALADQAQFDAKAKIHGTTKE